MNSFVGDEDTQAHSRGVVTHQHILILNKQLQKQ